MGEFRASFAQSAPPTGLEPALLALWWAGKRDWDKAHEIAQSIETQDGAWVHAYLHRVEGDLVNANYWYRAAHRSPARGALEAEWSDIAAALLAGGR